VDPKKKMVEILLCTKELEQRE